MTECNKGRVHDTQVPGALAHWDSLIVTRAAQDCLALYTRGGAGARHMMARRFLEPGFNGGVQDPGLRVQVEHLASGGTIAGLPLEQQRNIAYWLAALRTAPCHGMRRQVNEVKLLVTRCSDSLHITAFALGTRRGAFC